MDHWKEDAGATENFGESGALGVHSLSGLVDAGELPFAIMERQGRTRVGRVASVK